MKTPQLNRHESAGCADHRPFGQPNTLLAAHPRYAALVVVCQRCYVTLQ